MSAATSVMLCRRWTGRSPWSREFAVDNRDEVVRTFDNATKVFRTMLSKRTALTEILRVMPVTLENLIRLPVNGRVPTRVDPLVIGPLGNELRELCEQLPLGLCDLLSGTDPLGGLLP